MTLYTDPPPLRSFPEVKPTLLVCWWITILCCTIILFRVGGRFIRTERLFPDDKTAALAMIPLLARMGCVHVILLYGTNNADLSGVDLTDEELRRKKVASGLVLASRIFYAATLWTLKNTTLDFFKRLIGLTWTKAYHTMLFYLRCTLGATFVAIIISDLVECQPFSHYWQVLPDPGGRCRQGYAQLLTMAVCNVLTDLLLVFFPIPIIIRSHMTWKRKAQLVALFSLSLGVVATTLYRVPHVINAQGSQQLRSLLASVELLFATTAANALVLGSFVRDRGLKKHKFKGSFADSLDRPGGHGPPHITGVKRRPVFHRHWGSDEDLVRDLGLGVSPSLRNNPDPHEHDQEALLGQRKFTPAPPVAPDMSHWRFPSNNRHSGQSGDSAFSDGKRGSIIGASEADLLSRDNMSPSPMASRSNSTASPRKVSFYDIGGLIQDDNGAVFNNAPRRDSYNAPRRDSYHSSIDPLTPIGPFITGSNIPSPSLPAPQSGFRRGSTALLQDLGGLLPLGQSLSRQGRNSRSRRSTGTELHPIPQGRPGGLPDLQDAGGLLDRPP